MERSNCTRARSFTNHNRPRVRSGAAVCDHHQPPPHGYTSAATKNSISRARYPRNKTNQDAPSGLYPDDIYQLPILLDPPRPSCPIQLYLHLRPISMRGAPSSPPPPDHNDRHHHQRQHRHTPEHDARHRTTAQPRTGPASVSAG